MKESYLQEAETRIESLGEIVHLRQLSGFDETQFTTAFAAATDDTARALCGAMVLRAGVPALADKTIDQIVRMFTTAQMDEIAAAINAIGAADPKSKPTPSVRSISG